MLLSLFSKLIFCFYISGSLELSGEGAYIEDDYITDYSVKQDLDFLGDTDYVSDVDVSDIVDDYMYPQNPDIPDVLHSSSEPKDDSTTAAEGSIQVSQVEGEGHKDEASSTTEDGGATTEARDIPIKEAQQQLPS